MSTRFSRAGRKPRPSNDDRVLPVPDGSKLPFPVEVGWTRLFFCLLILLMNLEQQVFDSFRKSRRFVLPFNAEIKDL